MIHYDRYPGDYLRDTLALTLAQDGAYTRLLDVYYTSESAIPDEDKFSLVRCRSKADEKVTQWVLDRFFERQEIEGKTVWIHAKCEREIAKSKKRIAAARENGKNGGRPRKDREPETQSVFPGKPNTEPSKKLTTNHQSPITRSVATATDPQHAAADSLKDRAQRILDNPHDATWNEPKHWPEVLDVARAHASAQGLAEPRLLSYSADRGIRKLVELFAAGFTPRELASAAAGTWFVEGRRGLASLSPTVVAKSATSPSPTAAVDGIVLEEANKWQ